jgi:L-cysteine desulfidase
MLAVVSLASSSTAVWLRRHLPTTHRAPRRRLGGFNEVVMLNAGSGSVDCVSEQPVIETEESEADSYANNQIVE